MFILTAKNFLNKREDKKKMKRYVTEFANDEIRTIERYKENYGRDVATGKIERIKMTVENCKNGLITDKEAIKCILDE